MHHLPLLMSTVTRLEGRSDLLTGASVSSGVAITGEVRPGMSYSAMAKLFLFKVLLVAGYESIADMISAVFLTSADFSDELRLVCAATGSEPSVRRLEFTSCFWSRNAVV